MAGNARFHDKLHRKNHHTNPTVGFADSATDPIASPSEPFQGDFVLNGKLSASSGIQTLSANVSGDIYCNNIHVSSVTYTNFISGNSTETIISDGALTGYGANTLTLDYKKAIYNKVNNNTIMYMNSSRVGINNSNPTTTMDISGNTRIIATDSTTDLGALTIIKPTSAYNTNDLVIHTHGGVIPSAGGLKLRSSGGSYTTPTATVSGRIGFVIGSSTHDGITWVNSSAMNLGIESNPLENYHPSYIAFETTESNFAGRTERMRINSLGNIGIGTTTPTEKLHVDGNLLVTGNISALGDLTQINTSIVTTSAMIIDTLGTTDALRVTQRGTGNAILVEDDTNPDSSAFIVNSAGDVGIGTITPNQKLTVNGGISSNNYIYSQDIFLNRGNDQREGGQINFARSFDNTNAFAIDTYTDNIGSLSSRLRFIDVTSNAERMTILSSGNVGIGVGNPNSTLHVSGDFTLPNYTLLGSLTGSTNGAVNIAGGNNFLNGSGGAISVRGLTNTFNGGGMEFYYGNGTYTMEAMRIVSGGNVGIGTTNPESKFHVFGNANTMLLEADSSSQEVAIDFKCNSTGGRRWRLGTGGTLGGYANGSIGFYDVTSGSMRMMITSSGNVAIGPNYTTEELHVSKINAGSQTVIKVENSSTDHASQARFDMATGTPNAYSILYVSENSTNGPFAAWEQGEGLIGGTYIRAASAACMYLGHAAANRLTILSGGDVGIGTDTPYSKLHVTGAITLDAENLSASSGFGVVDASNLSATYISFRSSNSVNDWAYIRQIGGYNNFHLSLDLHDDGNNINEGQSFSIRNIGSSVSSPDPAPETRFIINGLGNVGIGTDAPTDRLYVTDSGGTMTNITRPGGWGGGITTFDVYAGGTIGAGSMTGDLSASIGNNGVIMGKSLAGIGNRAVYSDSYGTLTNTSSDRTLKQSVSTISQGLDEVILLNPVSFNWKNTEKYGPQREIGFIAQEVQELIPEVIGTNSDGTLSLDYAKMIAVLTKSIQELNDKIDAQAKEIAKLKSK
jgi:hypothetical protein